MSKRNAVYWIYDAEDVLLYVGVSDHFGRRWDQHARSQSWWPDADHQTVRWYASRGDAELAEKVAINDEGPIHNIRDSPWEKRVKDDGTGFYVALKPPPEKRTGTRGTKREAIRVEPELWREYGMVCEADSTNRSLDLRTHMERKVRAWKRKIKRQEG